MWPFVKHASVDLASITAATPVDVEVRVASPNEVTSPVTGARAAAFVVEVVSRHVDGRESLGSTSPAVGSLVLGDRIALAPEASDVTIVAVLRRMKLAFHREVRAQPITTAPPELVPFLGKVRLGETAWFREHAMAQGDRMRLRAVLERAESGGAGAFATRPVLIVRDDLGPAVLEAIFDVAL